MPETVVRPHVSAVPATRRWAAGRRDEPEIVEDARLDRRSDVPSAVARAPVDAVDEGAHGDLLVAREAERVLEADGARERLGDRGGERIDAVVEPTAADRVVPVDLEPGHGLPGVDGERRPEVVRVAEDADGHVDRAVLRALAEAEREPVRGDVRPVLPALVSTHRAEEVDRLVAL